MRDAAILRTLTRRPSVRARFCALVLSTCVAAASCARSTKSASETAAGTSNGGSPSAGRAGAATGGIAGERRDGGAPAGGSSAARDAGAGNGGGVAGTARDGGAAPAGGAPDAGAAGDAGDAGMGSAADCRGCAGNEGCLEAVVSRHDNDSQQPWIKFGFLADGVGTLVTSATQGGSLASQRRVPSVDMRPKGASVTVNLGCLRPGAYVASAFLDDNVNAAEGQLMSRDAEDSCMGVYGPETVRVQVDPGRQASVELRLGGSCDPDAE